MSTVIAANTNGVVILAADSRSTICHHDTGKLTSRDDTEKIFEIATGVFWAAAGHNDFIAEMLDIARQLAQTADLNNPEGFANELDRASRPAMDRTIAKIIALRSMVPFCEEEASGAKAFYTYALAFVSDKCPGYIFHEFRLDDGQPVCRKSCQFKLAARSIKCFAVGGPLIEHLSKNPKTWLDGPVRAVEKLVDGLRGATPAVGGPTQMVRIDRRGARWIHRLADPQIISGARCQTVASSLTLNASEILLQHNGSSFVQITPSSVLVNQGTLVLDLNNVTTSIQNNTISGLGVAGIQVVANSNGAFSCIIPGLFQGSNAAGTIAATVGEFGTTAGLAAVNGSATISLTTNGSTTILSMSNLPSSSPGSGSKQFWYDPSDGNRIKFAA